MRQKNAEVDDCPRPPANETTCAVKRACALIAGVILCRWIFVPLSQVLSTELFLLIMPARYDLRFIILQQTLNALGFCVSGVLTGVLVSAFSRNREIGTTALAAGVVAVWYMIEFGAISFGTGLSRSNLAYSLLEVVVCATCLLASAIIGAGLIARKRELSERANGVNDDAPPAPDF